VYKFLIINFLILIAFAAKPQELERFKNLEGEWRFSIGDMPEWAAKDFNDNDWDIISAPNNWESQGYDGYNGFAWYRKSFFIGELNDNLPIILCLGRIDDVDEVYINGKKIGGSGAFFPDYKTAYQEERKYIIPEEIINQNAENVIAIRVYDMYLTGGIMQGPLGFYYDITNSLLEINLSGTWRFALSEPSDNINPKLSDLKWGNITVPGYWEQQGFDNYDGYAVYYKKVIISDELAKKDLVLVLGKIDDYDYVYFNGKLIGSIVDLKDEGAYFGKGNEYTALRGYRIPGELINAGNENTIIVKVYDYFKDGGIYEGPIGIMTSEKFNILRKKYYNHKNINTIWDLIFN